MTMIETETRFRVLAAKGSRKRGLELLQKLDAHFGSNEIASEGYTVHEGGEKYEGE